MSGSAGGCGDLAFLCLPLSLSLSVDPLLYFSPFLSLTHFVVGAFTGGSKGSKPRSQSTKSGFKCSHTWVCPIGTSPTSHLAAKVENIVRMHLCVWCVCLCVSAAACQFIAPVSCCNLLMDHLWGVICIMQKWGVQTPLKTDSFNPLHASPLLFFLCVQEARRQKEQISELQVEKDRPKM